jgi:hypothetical protein
MHVALRLPAELTSRFGGVGATYHDLRRTQERCITYYMLMPVKAYRLKHCSNKLLKRVCLSGGNNIIVWLFLLQHHPHGFYILGSATSVADDCDVPQTKTPRGNAAGSFDDLADHKSFRT